MTKLASALPDGHGLDAVRGQLLEKPHTKHVGVVVVNCSKVTIDHDKGGREPTAAVRTIEIVHPDDLELTQKILTRGRDRRVGATVLPLDVEDDVTSAFKSRSEDYGTDLEGHTGTLSDEQTKALAKSLDQPLRHELSRAMLALRDSKEWVTLGRARRVLQLVVRKLEDNDKRLLRDEDGNLVDPETGAVVDEDTLTTERLDEMLAAYFDQLDEQGAQLPLDEQGDEDVYPPDAVEGDPQT